jgi:hypothetical protein
VLYLRYHIASGAITSRISLDPEVAVETNPDYALIQGDGHQQTHWVSRGEIALRVPYDAHSAPSLVQSSADAQPVVEGLPGPCWVVVTGRGSIDFAQQLVHVPGDTLDFVPALPGSYAVALEGQFVGPEVRFEVIDLDALKARRNDEVSARKLVAMDAGATWDGHRWDADEGSQAALNAQVQRIAAGGRLPAGFYWTDFHGQDVPVSADDLIAISDAMASYSFAVHDRARKLKRAVQDCSSVDALEALDITSTWPS